MNHPQYVSVDDLQAQTTLQEAAAKCSATIEVHGSGRQIRLDCPFRCPGDHAGKRELSVDTGNPQKVFACHAYNCQMRGNLLTLMHGWLTGTRPTGDKLKGDEFKRVRTVLADESPTPNSLSALAEAEKPVEAKPAPARNMPLAQNENEKARELVTLDEKFLRDVAYMPPTAAMYVRRHACLTPAMMEKWRVGVLPQDGGPDKRGWSIRGQLLYPVLSEDGKLLAWVARDPQFETKEQNFNALAPEQRAKEKKPHKHRFPVDFHRGQELFGQHVGRLEEPGYRESIAACGIIMVEGFNDVLGLDGLGVPAVAIMSNKITEQQVAKVARFARSLAGGKVTLLFDLDAAGEEGVKEALWLLAQRGLDVRLGWSRAMHDGRFTGRQPGCGVTWRGSAVVTATGGMVPEPCRDPTQVGCDPHPGAASVTRERVPACRPVVGVAAEVATWSPSWHGPSRGFPKPPERSNSVRLSIAARSPLRAIPRRLPGGP